MVQVYDKENKSEKLPNEDSTKKNKNPKEPKFGLKIILSLLFSIVFMCLFALTYTNSVDLNPFYLTQDFFNEYVEHASDESTDKFYNAISSQCDDLLDLFDIIEVDLSFDEPTIRKKLSESGLKEEEIEKIVNLHSYCKNTLYSKEVFFNKMIVSLLEQNNISNDTQVSQVVDNFEVLFSSDNDENSIDEPTNNLTKKTSIFEKLLMAISAMLEIFFSTGKIIALLLICLIFIIILGFNYWYYIFNKLGKVFLKLGVFLLLPYLLLSFYLSVNPIDTSLIFSKLSEFLSSGVNISFNTIFSDLLKSSILILLRILYPAQLAIKGLIIVILSVLALIFLKKSKEKELFNSEKIE